MHTCCNPTEELSSRVIVLHREFAQAEFAKAAAVDGPVQAEAFTWLGHWFLNVAEDSVRARRCYKKALSLDPNQVRRGVHF